jgi:hypothetical protein
MGKRRLAFEGGYLRSAQRSYLENEYLFRSFSYHEDHAFSEILAAKSQGRWMDEPEVDIREGS